MINKVLLYYLKKLPLLLLLLLSLLLLFGSVVIMQYLRELFSLRSVDYFLRRTDILTLSKPCTTTYGLNSFTYSASKFLNALPDRLRAISCLNDFIRAI